MTDEARLAQLLTLRDRTDAEIRRVGERLKDAATNRRRRRVARATCGTDGGYYHHRRITRTTPCEECKKAHALAARVGRLKRLTAVGGALPNPAPLGENGTTTPGLSEGI